MISECRIYTPEGKLKKVVSAKKLTKRYWEKALADFEPPNRQASRQVAAKKSRNRPAGPRAKEIARLVVQYMRENKPPRGHKGWSARHLLQEIGIKSTDKDYQLGRSVVRRAHEPAYGGHPVKSVSRGGFDIRLQYYLEEE